MATHVMTPARKAALHKAQLASAARRRGRHWGNVNAARYKRNAARKRAGLSYSKRKAINSQFEADVNASRVKTLGKNPRSQRNQAIRRKARVVGKDVHMVAGTALLVAASHPTLAMSVSRKTTQGVRVAHGAPHFAKGFAKGAHSGYATRRASQRNLRNRGMTGSGPIKVQSQRMGPLALSAGTGRGHTGRRVRGY